MDQEDDAGDIGLAKINDHSIFVNVPVSKPRRPIPHLRRVSSSFTTSPTSPEDPNKLNIAPTRSPSALARSQTLPRIRPRSPLLAPSSLKFDAPPLDDQITAAVRRWIHCIVLGTSILLPVIPL
ncbi:hypothetical protein BD410DRAFT_607266 [Rickenella mellea]|uniref:Uncharacterized protein n=1 Tax=Rickenella mellea TaxID=50990 RepID=A0A4Y7QEY3_9AGAM|nr:hypothetical protein BD410DRAFT_607266 [Rickenella mellea]